MDKDKILSYCSNEQLLYYLKSFMNDNEYNQFITDNDISITNINDIPQSQIINYIKTYSEVIWNDLYKTLINNLY